MEWEGAFGDLGTLIPFVVAYITVLGIDSLGLLFMFGICKIAAGFYQNDAEDHGREPVGESVPAEGWQKGSDMICSGHGNKAECSWGISSRISCCLDPEISQKDIERGPATIY